MLKKNPIKKFEKLSGKHPYVGTMAAESSLRKTSYLKTGCNSFDSIRPMSLPIAFWEEEDIWNYLKLYNLPYSNIYNMGYDRTGCMFCLFGIEKEKEPNRFQKMMISHPAQYNYCINHLNIKDVLSYMNVAYQ